MPPDPPQAVPDEVAARVVAWLEGNGFRRLTYRYGHDVFGNTLIIYQRGGVGIRLIRDRSQWFLDVANMENLSWFLLDIWESCVSDERRVPRGSMDVETLDHLIRLQPEIDLHLRVDPNLVGCLLRERSATSRVH
jgi:hypothetical protein